METEERYVTYKNGNAPIIITCPHDGILVHPELKTQRQGVTIRDLYTSILGSKVQDAFNSDSKPYFVSFNLTRKQIDVNRNLSEAIAKGTEKERTIATRIYNLYHSKISKLIEEILNDFSMVVLLDFHGQGHRNDYAELGYLLSHSEIHTLYQETHNKENVSKLTKTNLYKKSSLYQSTISNKANEGLDLIWGSSSLGTILTSRGFKCLPSAEFPTIPRNDRKEMKYFSGGYTLQKYATSKLPVIGIQLEFPTNWRSTKKGKSHKPKTSELTTLSLALKDSITAFVENFSKL